MSDYKSKEQFEAEQAATKESRRFPGGYPDQGQSGLTAEETARTAGAPRDESYANKNQGRYDNPSLMTDSGKSPYRDGRNTPTDNVEARAAAARAEIVNAANVPQTQIVLERAAEKDALAKKHQAEKDALEARGTSRAQVARELAAYNAGNPTEAGFPPAVKTEVEKRTDAQNSAAAYNANSTVKPPYDPTFGK